MTAPLKSGTVGNVVHGSHGRRFAAHFEARPQDVRPLPDDNPAVVDGRSIFQHSVVSPEDAGRILISGANQRKIGAFVSKGKWRGFPIYTLTLEERASCPRSCEHWLSCYGSTMPYARRHRHGENLEVILAAEVKLLAIRHPAGFVVRLHVLGDFYSREYVGLWHTLLLQTPALHIFGYTANHPNGDIGLAVNILNFSFPGRVSIRFSGENVPAHVLRARTIWRQPESHMVEEGLVCPAQTGRVECCGACGFCWQSDKPVAFIAHGRVVRGKGKKAGHDI